MYTKLVKNIRVRSNNYMKENISFLLIIIFLFFIKDFISFQYKNPVVSLVKKKLQLNNNKTILKKRHGVSFIVIKNSLAKILVYHLSFKSVLNSIFLVLHDKVFCNDLFMH